MILTKEQQIEILHGASELIKTEVCTGLCAAIQNAYELSHLHLYERPEIIIPSFTFQNVYELCLENRIAIPNLSYRNPYECYWWTVHSEISIKIRLDVIDILIKELQDV